MASYWKQDALGVLHPQFSQVKDILIKGENRTPLLIMKYTSLISYLPSMRSHLVAQTPSLISIIHPSSILFYEPMSSRCIEENFILKSRVDLTAFLENGLF